MKIYGTQLRDIILPVGRPRINNKQLQIKNFCSWDNCLAPHGFKIDIVCKN